MGRTRRGGPQQLSPVRCRHRDAGARRARGREASSSSLLAQDRGNIDRLDVASCHHNLISPAREARANELITALDGQDFPRPITCCLFAEKMISIIKSRSTTDKTFGKLAFACGYVMLLVSNQVPDAMDYLLAEFHKVCMYTVPKHLHALNAEARTPEYYRLIGYQEEDGKVQSIESYLVNVVAYVKLYAAMIQTEIKGVRHPHGLAEGWKWLATFLNTLPAIPVTALALHAFLKIAGFALHKKYGSQFMKILDVISRRFIPALKERGAKNHPEAISNLENYLKDKVYLEEPEGQYLAQHLLSKVFM